MCVNLVNVTFVNNNVIYPTTTNAQEEKANFTIVPKICYLEVKRDNIDGYLRGSRKVLKCSGQKSLREKEPWYPENLQKKQNYHYGKASTGKIKCSVIIWTYWGYSMFYPLLNELNSSYQISYPGRQRFKRGVGLIMNHNTKQVLFF